MILRYSNHSPQHRENWPINLLVIEAIMIGIWGRHNFDPVIKPSQLGIFLEEVLLYSSMRREVFIPALLQSAAEAPVSRSLAR